MQQIDNQVFEFNKNFSNPDEYSITLENENSKNKDRIAYRVDVIKDQFPAIVVDHLRDSVLFKSIILAGNIQDDYGLSQLELHYQITGKDKEEKSSIIPITIDRAQQQQNFFYHWMLDSLHLTADDRLQYYLEVWDNDGVHGHKSTKSAAYLFDLPYPQLGIARDAATVSIKWVTPETGLTLQEADRLGTSLIWSNTSGPVSIHGNTNSVQHALESTNRFFRLRRP